MRVEGERIVSKRHAERRTRFVWCLPTTMAPPDAAGTGRRAREVEEGVRTKRDPALLANLFSHEPSIVTQEPSAVMRSRRARRYTEPRKPRGERGLTRNDKRDAKPSPRAGRRDVFDFLFEMCAARAIRARYLIFCCDLRHYLHSKLFARNLRPLIFAVC